jgi:hypothetical protein
MSRWQTNGKTSLGFVVLGIVLFFAPLILAITWGLYFGDSAFVTFQAAHSIIGDMGRLAPEFVLGTAAQTPLYIGLMAAVGQSAPQVGLIASALGWSASALLMLFTLHAARRPVTAIVTPLLLVFSPLVITTSGTEYSWVVALGWAALALSFFPWPNVQQAPWLKLLLLFLLLGLNFNAATILFALALLAIDVFYGRSTWLPFALLAAASFFWGLWAIPRTGSPPAVDPTLWLQNGRTLFANRQLYWLYLPFIVAGLWDLWSWNSVEAAPDPDTSRYDPAAGQKFFALLLLWAAAAGLAQTTSAPVLAAVTAVALSGLGVGWLTRKMLDSERLEFDRQRAAVLVPIMLSLPLLLVSILTLRDLFRTRPIQQAALQDQAAAWLVENAAPETILYAPPRAGYLAGLSTIPAAVEQIRDGNVGQVYEQLLDHAPDYILSENSLAWDYVTRTTWFRERYRERARFADDYAADSPLTIWQYTPPSYEAGEPEAISAVVNDQFALVGYEFEPRVIKPGEEIFLTLYLQALEPLDYGFITGIHLSAPDGWVWAWREELTPTALSGQWWEPGQVIPERFRLQTTEDIPLGAYDLQVFWRPGDDKSNWPIVREGDEAVLDRIFLGNVVAPLAVNTGQASPVKAQFGDSILLDSYQISAQPAAGQPLDVTLYWQALSQPADDYTVFVHLLDEQGQIVAAHDGMPAENSFPTRAWQPGLLVGDTHRLELPAELAPGDYQVNVGLYLLETGERLPVWDAQGVEQEDRSLPLATVSVTGDR